MTEFAEKVKVSHTIQVGAIVYNSWGCDQTNVDFYEVVGVSAYFVKLRPLQNTIRETGFMCGTAEPQPGVYASGHVTRHKVISVSGEAYVKFEYGSGRVWDGKPKSCSWYA